MYFSESKNKFVSISEMDSRHLLNALRKVMSKFSLDESIDTLLSLSNELKIRLDAGLITMRASDDENFNFGSMVLAVAKTFIEQKSLVDLFALNEYCRMIKKGDIKVFFFTKEEVLSNKISNLIQTHADVNLTDELMALFTK